MSIPFTEYNDGDPLIFAHANGYPPACYEPFFDQLTGNKVLAMHQRPLWRNSEPSELKDWRPLSDDLIRFIDEQKLDKAIAIGHSFKGVKGVYRDQSYIKRLYIIKELLINRK